MIKVNLTKQKKSFKIPVIAGVDFSYLNYKMMLIAFAILYFPHMYLDGIYEEKTGMMENDFNKYTRELKKLENNIKKHNQVRDQLNSFRRQIEKLKKRSSSVQKILKDKSNPNKLLERVAKDTPNDMWFDSIKITQDKELEIKGSSISYRSIGSFIMSANESSFFGKSLELDKYNTITSQDSNKEKRVESFVIKGRIVTFDPWSQ